MNPTKEQLKKVALKQKEQKKVLQESYKILRKAEKLFNNNKVAEMMIQECESKICWIIKEGLN